MGAEVTTDPPGAPGPAAPSPARAAAGMGVATAVSRAFGFLRVLVVAAVLGTTYLGNTFQASNSVSNVLFELLAAGALSAVLVPTFVDLLERQRREDCERLAGGLLGLALTGLGVVTVAGVVGAPWLARVLASGVSDPALAARQQALATDLLRWFVPQVLLYALGAVAIALLYATRRFAITAAAPIANTLVMVAALVVFRLLAGPHPGLDLTGTERLTLALGGTLGVAAFVVVPVVALQRAGIRLRPRWPGRDPALRRLLGLSAWAVFQHSAAGLLLGAAIVVAGAVEGGVVAYQVAFVFFLAPYAVLAQPVHTAVLPDLSLAASRADPDAFRRSLRWALESMAVLVAPVAAALVTLALPVMRVVAFGRATDAGGVGLLAAALAGLAPGLLSYGAFLLLARASYALGDSRTPALAALGSAALGVVGMVVASRAAHGAALVAGLGLAHSVAYTAGAGALAVALVRRGALTVTAPRAVRAGAVCVPLGLLAWAAGEAVAPTGRLGSAALVGAVVVGGSLVYLGGLRALGVDVLRRAPSRRRAPTAVGRW